MATIDDRRLIRRMLLNNGHYDTDPQAYEIWSYLNDWSNWTQAVFWHPGHDLELSPHVHFPVLLWSQSTGLTLHGQDWLHRNDAFLKEEEVEKGTTE
jgi:hypothetical protein